MSADTDRIQWPGWETTQLIGRGSFGEVYEIQRSVLGDIEKAALKIISIPQNESDIEEMHSDGYDDESITSTFKSHLKSIVAEYSLMRKMNGSANIVSCDDIRYIQHDDGIGWDVFIKMELLTPLTKALPTKIPEETVVKIAKDMCSALELCKKHEIVHRDIKPQNIFVAPNGDYKLGDFGIAKTVEKTMGGTKIGTYRYMAPEVYNNQPYGMAADIYSLGLVLYWMLNERRMPFLPLPPAKLSAGMDEEARDRRCTGEMIPAPKNGNKELKAIVLKACAFDPKDRYQSAREMLDALTSDSPPPPPPPPPVLDIYKEMTFSHQSHPAGKACSIRIDAREVQFTIPADIQNGQIIRLPGEGKFDHTTGAVGDLYITIHIVNDSPPPPPPPPPIKWYLIAAIGVVVILCIALFASRKCNHSWVEATCINPQFCEKCGDVIGNTTAHKWIEATSSAPKTCTVCGLTKGSALTVDDNSASTTAPTDTTSSVAAEETTKPTSKHSDIEGKINNADLAHKPEPLYDEPIAYTCVSKEGVIRRGYGTEYRQIGGALQGETVYVYAKHGAWYFVENERGKVGWAAFEMVEKDG